MSVSDQSISYPIPPTLMHYVTGTWADAAGAVAGTIVKARAAADGSSVINIPVVIPHSTKSSTEKGSFVKSIDLWWAVTVAAMDAVTAVINLITMGANGAAQSVEAQAFTYDADHDTAGERLTLDEHKMTLTLTTPIWLGDGEQLSVELTIDAALTSVFQMVGAQINTTHREG